MKSSFVGRDVFFNQLRSWLTEPHRSQLKVISVEGAGGIGKTTLINEVLASTNLKNNGYLIIELRGEDFREQKGSEDPVTILAAIAQRCKDQLPRSNDPFFGLTMNLKAANNDLEGELQEKLDEKGDELTEATKAALRIAIRAGKFLGKNPLQGTEESGGFALNKKEEEECDKIINDFRKVHELGGSLWDTYVRPLFNSHAKNKDRLIRDVWSTLAEDFYVDLVAILAGWKKEPQNAAKLLPPKVQGKDNLLFFIDDYESMQSHFGKDFVLEKMVSALQGAPFKSALLISGRDDLTATDPGWKRRVSQELRDHTLRLTPLSVENVKTLLEINNVKGDLESLADGLYHETDGYPLLVEMAIEEGFGNQIPAISLKKFYDRQTHWMTETQKRWLEGLCFLDEINILTVRKVLDNGDAMAIQNWFEQEGSIRDTTTAVWTVRPFVRKRILKYLQSRDPKGYKEFQDRASN